MKIFEIVLFALTIVSVICSENVDKRSSNNEQEVALNRGEYYQPGGVPSDKHKGYDDRDQFGYKLKSKKYSEPKENVQYMIIKRTHDGPLPKRYAMAHSSTEMTTYHNKQPSKIAYSVTHKPKVMPVKVVQEGSVKHIYLDMPDLFDDVSLTPKAKPQTPKTYENVNQAASNTHYQYNNYNPGHYEQNYYRPSVQYTSAPTNINSVTSGTKYTSEPSNVNAAAIGISQQGFNTVSSGYKIGKINEQNPLAQEHGQQFPGEHFNSNGYTSSVYPVEAQYGSQDFGNSGHSSAQTPQFVPSYQTGYSHTQFPQFSEDGKERYMYEIPDQYKSLFSNNGNAYAASQSQEFSPNVAQNQPTYDFGKTQNQQTFDFDQTQNQQTYDFGKPQNQQTYDFGKPQNQQTYDFGKTVNEQTYDFGKTQNQQQTYDFGKVQTQQTYDFGKPQTQQTYDFGKQETQQTFELAQNQQSFDYGKPKTEQNYDFGKTARMSKVSGFDPNLLNIVNDVLNKGQGQPTPDGFRMIKSGDDKSVYLIGKPGMPLDTVPNLASYTFPANSGEPKQPQSQASSNFKFV